MPTSHALAITENSHFALGVAKTVWAPGAKCPWYSACLQVDSGTGPKGTVVNPAHEAQEAAFP